MGSEFLPILQRLTDLLKVVGLGLAAVGYTWAGILFITAMGSPQGVEKSKACAFYTSMGLVIVLVGGIIAGAVSRVATG